MTLMRIRQPHSYQEPTAEVIVTLCSFLRNHLHSETVSYWVDTGHFPPIRLSTINDHFYAHPPSHPWACFALHRKDRYQISITPVITKALFITICICPTSLTFRYPSWFLAAYKINKPAVTQGHQSLGRGSLVVLMYKLTTNQLWWY